MWTRAGLPLMAVVVSLGCASDVQPDSSNTSAGSAAQSQGGRDAAAGGMSAGGVAASTGGSNSAGASNVAGASNADRCSASGLVWRSANKTHYTSYPEPGSAECVEYNGCMWAGEFAACDQKRPESWVMAHDIVAAFPDFEALRLHDLCLRKGSKTLVVTVLDTCGDSDCDGCCTRNRGNADELIDVESYTDARWGVPDGAIEWADLGSTLDSGCN